MTSIEERETWFLNYVVISNRSDTPQHPPFFAGPETTKSAWGIESRPRSGTTSRASSRRFRPSNGAPRRRAGTCTATSSSATSRARHAVSSFDINREDGLWPWMDGLENTACRSSPIPHNSNASKGVMFDRSTPGKPIDAAYAETRAHFEPLIEMMQIKGNSEVHRNFWAADEFADFENADSWPITAGARQAGEFRPLRAHQGLGIRAHAGSQSLPVWLRRRHGQPQRHARQHRRRQFQRRQPRRCRCHCRAAPHR